MKIENYKASWAATLVAFGLAMIGASRMEAVPVTYDLTAGGSATINGGIFVTTTQQPTGTGVIDPFLRLQGIGASAGLNSNSSTSNLLADTKSGTWTHDIMLSGIGVTAMSGGDYYTFFLDINQNTGGGQGASNALLSLDTLKLFTRSTSITDGTQDTLADVEAGDLRWNMDGIADSEVLLNYDLAPGSGAGDLFVYVPTSMFAADLGTDFLYLYSEFGGKEGYGDNDGYQEWATVKSVQVPDGGTTAILLGVALLGLSLASRRIRFAKV